MTQRVINYAKALFDLDISEECVQKTKDIICQNSELFDALSNPAIKKSEKHAVIDAIFDKQVRSYLKVICDNDCFEMINDIFNQYELIVLDSKNIINAKLTFVTKPNQDEIDKIKQFVCNKYKKAEVYLELKEDSSLLGGFILSVNGTEYDKSIQGTLSSLRKNLVWR